MSDMIGILKLFSMLVLLHQIFTVLYFHTLQDSKKPYQLPCIAAATHLVAGMAPRCQTDEVQTLVFED